MKEIFSISEPRVTGPFYIDQVAQTSDDVTSDLFPEKSSIDAQFSGLT